MAPSVKHIRRRIKDDSFGGTDTLSYQHCVDFLSLFHVHQSYGTSLSHLEKSRKCFINITLGLAVRLIKSGHIFLFRSITANLFTGIQFKLSVKASLLVSED